MVETFLAACELKNKVSAFARPRASAPRRLTARAVVLALSLFASTGPALAQEHPPAAQTQEAHAEQAEHHDESIGGMILAMGWPVANFIIFVGVLYYFFNQPIREYLANRGTAIRKDLVEAAALRSQASAQLSEIEQKLRALPGEIDRLRTRGAEEIKAEEQRIAVQAAADRERLLEQAKREIELQVRLAKKEILEHAANLSVQLATERIQKEITPEDQARLVDRYLDQMEKK
jgi:F-type H+-transporting ATPase subunit b